MRDSREYVVRFGGLRAILLEIPTYICGCFFGCVGVFGIVAFDKLPDGGARPLSFLLCLVFAVLGGASLWKLASLVWKTLSRTVAFRVDSDGITLTDPPLQVPWGAIENIALSRCTIHVNSIPAHSYCIHLGLRPEVERIDSHREMKWWQLDEEQLARAVAAHAPHIGVVKVY